jgi:hypothetical protein
MVENKYRHTSLYNRRRVERVREPVDQGDSAVAFTMHQPQPQAPFRPLRPNFIASSRSLSSFSSPSRTSLWRQAIQHGAEAGMASQIYIAHTGQRLHAEQLPFGSLEALKTFISNATDIPANDQILLTSKGKHVKAQSLLTEVSTYSGMVEIQKLML